MLCPKAVLTNCLFYTASLTERAMDFVKEDFRGRKYNFKQTIWVCGILPLLKQKNETNIYARILGLIYFIHKHSEIGTHSAMSLSGQTGGCHEKCTISCRRRGTLKECRWSMRDIAVEPQD
jgi:hypothetical protein